MEGVWVGILVGTFVGNIVGINVGIFVGTFVSIQNPQWQKIEKKNYPPTIFFCLSPSKKKNMDVFFLKGFIVTFYQKIEISRYQ
jgi:hypothetical protein